MNIRNEFILKLNVKLGHKTYEDRERIITRILADLDATDILSPINSVILEEVSAKEETIEERIYRKQLDIAKGLGIDESECVKTPFGSQSGRFGRSPLHEAVLAGDVESVKNFAQQKMYLDSKDNNGNTPLKLAYLEENKEIINILKG